MAQSSTQVLKLRILGLRVLVGFEAWGESEKADWYRISPELSHTNSGF